MYGLGLGVVFKVKNIITVWSKLDQGVHSPRYSGGEGRTTVIRMTMARLARPVAFGRTPHLFWSLARKIYREQ